MKVSYTDGDEIWHIKHWLGQVRPIKQEGKHKEVKLLKQQENPFRIIQETDYKYKPAAEESIL